MTLPSRRPRALIVAYCFPPYAAIGTQRTVRVVRQLDALGWDVTVLTGTPSAYREGAAVTDAALLRQIPSAVKILRATPARPLTRAQRIVGRLRTARQRPAESRTAPRQSEPRPAQTRSGSRSALVRVHDVVDAAFSIPDQESGWLIPAIGKAVYESVASARPDVIYSSAPPWTGQLVALGLKRVLRRPWVADFRDPWARAPWRGDRYRFWMSAAAQLERIVVRNADRVIFVTESNRDEFTSHYGPELASKFELVYNGCDPGEFDALRSARREPSDRFVLLHAGSLYAGRTPEPLMAGLAAALAEGRIDRERFRVRFLGTNAIPEMAAICRTLGLDDIVDFLPRVPRAESLRAMANSSGLLLLQPGHTISIPGKAYEYLASGRPILAIVEEGETADLIRRSGAGIAVTRHEPAIIADALVAMVARADAPQPPAQRELYDGTLGAMRIARLLEGVAQCGLPSATLAGAKAESR